MLLLVFHVLFLITIDLLNKCLVNQCKIWKFYRTGVIFLTLKYFHLHLYTQVTRTNLIYTIYHAWLSFVDPLQWHGDFFCCFFFFLAFMLTHDSPSMHKKNYFFFFKNSITPRFGSFSSNKFHDLKRGSIIHKNVFKNRFDRCYEDQNIESI